MKKSTSLIELGTAIVLAALLATSSTFAQTTSSPVILGSSSVNGSGTERTFTGTFTNTSSSTQTVLVELSLHDMHDNKIVSEAFDDITLTPGENRDLNLTSSTTVVSDLNPTPYRFKAGIFSEDGATLLAWYDTAKGFSVRDPNRSSAMTTVATSSVSVSTSDDGQSNLAVTIQNSGSPTVAIIDFEAYDENGNRVWQQFYEDERFGQDESRRYNVSTPNSLALGKYHWKVGIFSPWWSELLTWHDDLDSFVISFDNDNFNQTATTTSQIMSPSAATAFSEAMTHNINTTTATTSDQTETTSTNTATTTDQTILDDTDNESQSIVATSTDQSIDSNTTATSTEQTQ